MFSRSYTGLQAIVLGLILISMILLLTGMLVIPKSDFQVEAVLSRGQVAADELATLEIRVRSLRLSETTFEVRLKVEPPLMKIFYEGVPVPAVGDIYVSTGLRVPSLGSGTFSYVLQPVLPQGYRTQVYGITVDVIVEGVLRQRTNLELKVVSP